jgi:hypothetical protein
MRLSNQGGLRQQISFLRRQFLQDGDLPFTDVLSDKLVIQALTAAGVVWNDSIYQPLVTLWVFLGQVISSDHSCRAAVARLIAHRLSQGQSSCSAETGAYCQARKRLPEKFFSDVARQTGQTLDTNARSHWLWQGRRVYTYDGSTVTMPDTPENQGDYPQNVAQKPGLGFPIARIAAVFSLSCGAIIDFGICRYAGKGQSELGMLRTLMNIFQSGDVLLADRYMCAWRELFMLKRRGVDCVCRLNVNRKADFRKGKRLSKGDHLVRWPKPAFIRSLSWQAQKKLPEFITVRECCVHVGQAGFRSHTIIIVTTLLDAEKFTTEEIAGLYRARWNAELDLRSLKQTLQMDILRCKTPELVRKEIWTHILAYNLIRTLMAQAATKQNIEPRTISFKGALQMLEAFQPEIKHVHNAESRMHFYQALLDAVATHRVGNRPDRVEPRLLKRRRKRDMYLSKPRQEMKREMLKRLK